MCHGAHFHANNLTTYLTLVPCGQGWNLRDLKTLLSTVLDENGFKVPGVNTVSVSQAYVNKFRDGP